MECKKLGYREQNGFSLTEVILVLIISGILIGLSYPIYHTLKRRTEEQNTKEALKSVIATIDADIAANGGIAPSFEELIPTERLRTVQAPMPSAATTLQKKIDALWSPTTQVLRYKPIHNIDSTNQRLGKDSYIVCMASAIHTKPTAYVYDSHLGITTEIEQSIPVTIGHPIASTPCP